VIVYRPWKPQKMFSKINLREPTFLIHIGPEFLYGYISAFKRDTEPKLPKNTLNHIQGVEHGFMVVPVFVSKITAKMAISAAYRAQLGHFGIQKR
tara:strand:+ start:128 stop:412 length:285 start_codon:yes stop_codon:yes gene_type:complete